MNNSEDAQYRKLFAWSLFTTIHKQYDKASEFLFFFHCRYLVLFSGGKLVTVNHGVVNSY